MSRWGAAMAGAVGAVANVGVQQIDRNLRMQDQAEAEQRAADLKIDTTTRLMAAQEMAQNRAAERFAALTGDALKEAVPLEAQNVEETGITRDSAMAAGTGPGFEMAPEKLAKIEADWRAVQNDPNAPAQLKADAAGVLAQIERQRNEQAGLNAKAVDGKTRPRTLAEARSVAFDTAAVTDPAAMAAGTSMWKSAMDTERLDSKEKSSRGETRAEKEADRASRERVAAMQVDARRDIAGAETERKTQADAQRYETSKARIEALAGGKGAKATALMQNVEFLEQRGETPESIKRFIFNAKDTSELEKSFKLLAADKFGDLTPEMALERVRGITTATATGKTATPFAGGEKIRTWNPATRKFE